FWEGPSGPEDDLAWLAEVPGREPLSLGDVTEGASTFDIGRSSWLAEVPGRDPLSFGDVTEGASTFDTGRSSDRLAFCPDGRGEGVHEV
ncbi:hypothetical protein C0991_000282, partial [Blastosporella zonata]